MVNFLELPRELRDMIYTAIITFERPRPTLGEAQWLFRFRRIFEPQSSVRGEYGCAYSLEPPPSTCANFLVCNRQIYAEMLDAIARAERRGRLAVRLDCIAEDESFHYFTWLSVPLVRTRREKQEGKSRIMPGWVDRMMGKYFACPHRLLSSGCLAYRTSATVIHQLWIDIRLVGDRSAKWLRNSSPPDRTSWAICAALGRIFDKGPDFSSLKDSAAGETTIDELVLNVVPPSTVLESQYLDEDFAADGVSEGLVHPKTVARELVDVWARIWAGEDFKGNFYRGLLGRVKRVRVCVEGETWRVRELRGELERGQKERARIAARGPLG